jgi:uncharacterized damage-inducible protein DinB
MIPVLCAYFEELEQLRAQFWGIIAAATPEQRHFKPKPDAWCMLQVAQHLIASESGTLAFIHKRAAKKNTVFGKIYAKIRTTMLKIFLHTPFKFKAPNIDGLSPQAAEPFEVVEKRWQAVRENWQQYLSNFETEQLNSVVFKHPVAGKMTIAQTLDNFMVAHIKHHLHQLKRLVAEPNFPK